MIAMTALLSLTEDLRKSYIIKQQWIYNQYEPIQI